jgi:hypothetical protein
MNRPLSHILPQALRRLAALVLLAAVGADASDSPAELLAVGRLLIPTVHFEEGYRRHYNERCTATLVSTADNTGDAPNGSSSARHSRLLLTAWHCLEYYRDLSRPILFEHSSGRRVAARAVSSGGGMHGDWALLHLAQPLPGAVPLRDERAEAGAQLLMVGYSRRADEPIPPLEVDADCELLDGRGPDMTTNCHVRRGASGGAVFSAETPRRYLGIISRGDSEQRSIYVPVSRVLPRLGAYLSRRHPADR